MPKTVPYHKCRAVPAVDCYFVLKTVDDLECSPVSFEECDEEVVDGNLSTHLACFGIDIAQEMKTEKTIGEMVFNNERAE